MNLRQRTRFIEYARITEKDLDVNVFNALKIGLGLRCLLGSLSQGVDMLLITLIARISMPATTNVTALTCKTLSTARNEDFKVLKIDDERSRSNGPERITLGGKGLPMPLHLLPS